MMFQQNTSKLIFSPLSVWFQDALKKSSLQCLRHILLPASIVCVEGTMWAEKNPRKCCFLYMLCSGQEISCCMLIEYSNNTDTQTYGLTHTLDTLPEWLTETPV